MDRSPDIVSNDCSRTLAWSNAGFIAQISGDGTKISFRSSIRDPKTGRWALGQEAKQIVEAPDGVRFVHVQFSGLGTDLAVADSDGAVHVYSTMVVLGKMQLAPASSSVNEGVRSELDAVVAIHWLQTWPAEFRVSHVRAEI